MLVFNEEYYEYSYLQTDRIAKTPVFTGFCKCLIISASVKIL
jgi:hypothetical protein